MSLPPNTIHAPTAAPTPGPQAWAANIWLGAMSLGCFALVGVGYLHSLSSAQGDGLMLAGTIFGVLAAVVQRLQGPLKITKDGIEAGVAAEVQQSTAAIDQQTDNGQRPQPAPAGPAHLTGAPMAAMFCATVGGVKLAETAAIPLPADVSRAVIAEAASAAALHVADSSTAITPEFRVDRALETFQTVYTLIRTGRLLPGGPQLLTPFAPPPGVAAIAEPQPTAHPPTGAAALQLAAAIAANLTAISRFFAQDEPAPQPVSVTGN